MSFEGFYSQNEEIKENTDSIESFTISEPEKLKIEQIDQETIDQLVHVDAVAFEGLRVNLTDQEVKEILGNKGAVHLVVRNNTQKIIGYLTSLPHNESYTYKIKADEKMIPKNNALYIESMAILPEYRSFKAFTSIIKKLFEEAKKSGYKYLTMHARVSNGLTNILQKKYKAIFIHRVEKFYGTVEAFDYLEIEL